MLPVFSQSSTPPPASTATAARTTAAEEASMQAPIAPPEEELAAFDIYAVHAKHQDAAEHSGFQVKHYRRAAPSSSQASSGDSFLFVESSSQQAWPMSASAKCIAPVHRPSLQVPRLGKPKHQVSELVVPESAISVKPQFSVKYPSHRPGTRKPPPVFSKRASLRPPVSQLGGAPVPLAKPRPKSIPHLCAGSPAQSHSQPILPPPAPRLAPAQPGKALKLPQARIPRASSSQAASEARREQMQAQLLVLVNLVGEHCQLFAILSASGHAAHHLKQLLAPFAASTLYRYIANCTAFADFVQAAHAPMQQLPVSLVVDFLYACSSSSSDQDRAVHRTSASSAVKSLRWL